MSERVIELGCGVLAEWSAGTAWLRIRGVNRERIGLPPDAVSKLVSFVELCEYTDDGRGDLSDRVMGRIAHLERQVSMATARAERAKRDLDLLQGLLGEVEA